MKSNTKWLLITAAIFLISGVFLFTVGFSVLGFNIYKLSTSSEYIEKAYDTDSEINSIKIEDSYTDIKLIKSKDDKFHIKYYENDSKTYEINDENGVLCIIKKNNKSLKDYIFNVELQYINLVVEIPESFNGSLAVDASYSAINACDFSVSEIDMTTSYSYVIVENIKSAGKFEINNAHGKIELDNVISNGNSVLKTSFDNIKIQQLEALDLLCITSHGGVYLESVKSQKNITCETSYDQIDIDDIDFGTKLNLETSYGGVYGNINGKISDYSIVTNISYGESNLPSESGSGNKNIYVKASYDDIDIEFKN